jgi:hypothetical protein
MTGSRAPRCHDPRISNIRWDKRKTRNAALIRADIHLEQGDPVDWEAVAVAADNDDWPLDANGEPVTWIWGPKA